MAVEGSVQMNGNHRQLIEDVIWRKIENEKLSLLDPMWDVQHHYTRELLRKAKESDLWFLCEIIAKRRLENGSVSGHLSSSNGQIEAQDLEAFSSTSRSDTLTSFTQDGDFQEVKNSDGTIRSLATLTSSQTISRSHGLHNNDISSVEADIKSYEINQKRYQDGVNLDLAKYQGDAIHEPLFENTTTESTKVPDVNKKSKLHQYIGSDLDCVTDGQSLDANTAFDSQYEYFLDYEATLDDEERKHRKTFTFYGNLDLRGKRSLSIDWYVLYC